MGGAIRETEPDATAFPHRDKEFAFTMAPKWTDPERDGEHLEWARAFHADVEPYAADGVYVNYMDDDESDRIETAYGDRLGRLRTIKTEWDPGNLFQVIQIIEPRV